MQEMISATQSRTEAASGFDVEILSVATANPPFVLSSVRSIEALEGSVSAPQCDVAGL